MSIYKFNISDNLILERGSLHKMAAPGSTVGCIIDSTVEPFSLIDNDTELIFKEGSIENVITEEFGATEASTTILTINNAYFTDYLRGYFNFTVPINADPRTYTLHFVFQGNNNKHIYEFHTDIALLVVNEDDKYLSFLEAVSPKAVKRAYATEQRYTVKGQNLDNITGFYLKKLTGDGPNKLSLTPLHRTDNTLDFKIRVDKDFIKMGKYSLVGIHKDSGDDIVAKESLIFESDN